MTAWLAARGVNREPERDLKMMVPWRGSGRAVGG
jgi:hypothetical protein